MTAYRVRRCAGEVGNGWVAVRCRPDLLPEAGARYKRTLEAVRYKPLLGATNSAFAGTRLTLIESW